MKEKVAILGASPKEDRYSYMALKLFEEQGYPVFPVNPRYSSIEESRCYSSLMEIPGSIDTVTVYLNPLHLKKQLEDLLAKKPARVIFNPGSESPDIAMTLEAAGIRVLEACTLVLLTTGQFETAFTRSGDNF